MHRRKREQRIHALFSEHLLENFPAPFAAAENETTVVVLNVAFQIIDRRLKASAIARKLPRRNGKQLLGRQALRKARGQEAVKIDGRVALYLRGEVFQAEIKFAQLSHQSSGLQKRVEPEAEFFLLRLCRARKCPVVAEIDGSFARKVVRRAGEFRINKRHVPVGRREVHAALQGFDIPRERGNQVLVGRFPPPLPRNDAL